MDDGLFNGLVQSVKQASQVRAGKEAPTQKFGFDPNDINKIRKELGLSQQEFTLTNGVSHRKLQNWRKATDSHKGQY